MTVVRAGGLDDRRDEGTREHALEAAVGDVTQNVTHPPAGGLLETFADELHSVQEQRHSTKQCDEHDVGHGRLFPARARALRRVPLSSAG